MHTICQPGEEQSPNALTSVKSVRTLEELSVKRVRSVEKKDLEDLVHIDSGRIIKGRQV